MELAARFIVAVCAGATVAACGSSSPTAPSTIATMAVSTPPFPAPVSQTMTGTWTAGDIRFTVAQRDESFTGMVTPFTIELAGPVTVDDTAVVNGTVSGSAVTFTQSDRITITGRGVKMACTAGATFKGTLAGNTLSGIVIPGPPVTCGDDEPPVTVPVVSGLVTFTRQ